ncbi:MAG: hypothetical protein WC528_02915 [Patescibacteria group bacterium]
MKSIIIFVLGIVAITCGVVVLHYMPGFDPWLLTIGVLIVGGGVVIVYVERDILEWLFFAFLGIIMTILFFLLGIFGMIAGIFSKAKQDLPTRQCLFGIVEAFICLISLIAVFRWERYSFIFLACISGLFAIVFFLSAWWIKRQA